MASFTQKKVYGQVSEDYDFVGMQFILSLQLIREKERSAEYSRQTSQEAEKKRDKNV